MVFQSYALYPHMTVAENIGFHLKITKVPKAERDQRVREAARILDLDDYLNRKPAKLSGGQRQRVAMGRAIVRQPQVFLMDEPLSNLDAKLRVQTRTQIAALQRRLGVTTVYVTHDQVEAMTMGDRVAVLLDGVLQQCATPRELFTRPGQRLRRRVHRLAGDEPADGRCRRGGCPLRVDVDPADAGAARRGHSRTGHGRRPPGGLPRRGVRRARRDRRSRRGAGLRVVPLLHRPRPRRRPGRRPHRRSEQRRARRPRQPRAGAGRPRTCSTPPRAHDSRATDHDRPCPSCASTRTPAPPSTSSRHARTVPTCRRRAARSVSAGSRRPSPTTCSGSRTDGRRWAATAARWCSTRRSTTPRSGRSASTASAR